MFRAGLEPMQLHWAPRHGVWEGCSFFRLTEHNDIITPRLTEHNDVIMLLFGGAPRLEFALCPAFAKAGLAHVI